MKKRLLGFAGYSLVTVCGFSQSTNCVAPSAGMVLWLSFDELSGTTSANLASPLDPATQVNSPVVVNGYVGHSLGLTKPHREKLLDAVAALVDENYAGRSEMCLQFADLLHRALTHLNFPSRAAVGTARYFSPEGREIYRWLHAWVRVGKKADRWQR